LRIFVLAPGALVPQQSGTIPDREAVKTSDHSIDCITLPRRQTTVVLMRK
jgi:hypothetical protein